MMRAVQLTLAALLYAQGALAQEGGWEAGRATFYGNEPWLWSIHEGSCGYGYIFPDEPLGWDVAAISDAHPDFAGSCGRCYEVKCDPRMFTDGYGNELDRTTACYDPEASLVVRTTDTCPCNYADNAYSNTRWCCGDVPHFDLSVWALEKLADTKWGVIPLQYRAVNCGAQPAKPAPAVANPFPGEEPPPGAVRTDRWGSVADIASQDTYVPRDVSETTTNVSQDWSGASWSADVSSVDGPEGGKAECADVQAGGALAYQGSEGDFDGKLVLDFWVDTANGVPDVDTYVGGGGSTCSPVKLQQLTQSGSEGSWSKYNVYLGRYDGQQQDKVVAFAERFTGCGGMEAKQLNRVEFRNDKGYQQRVCVGGAKIVAE